MVDDASLEESGTQLHAGLTGADLTAPLQYVNHIAASETVVVGPEAKLVSLDALVLITRRAESKQNKNQQKTKNTLIYELPRASRRQRNIFFNPNPQQKIADLETTALDLTFIFVRIRCRLLGKGNTEGV
jgi:hypothetical protein